MISIQIMLIEQGDQWNESRVQACLQRHNTPEAQEESCLQHIHLIAQSFGIKVYELITDELEQIPVGLQARFYSEKHKRHVTAKVRRDMLDKKIRKPESHYVPVGIPQTTANEVARLRDVRTGTIVGMDCKLYAQAISGVYIEARVKDMYYKWRNDDAILELTQVGKEASFISSIRKQVRALAKRHYAETGQYLPFDHISDVQILQVLRDTYSDWRAKGKLY